MRTKVWEETWTQDFDYGDQVRNEGGDWVLTAETFKGSATHEEEARARLAAAAPEMARLLLVACREYPGTDGACMYCDRYETQPHTEACKVGVLLRKAGVLA